MTQSGFQDLKNSNQLTISMIGMSNIGKTHWSELLATRGFDHVNCDDLVEAHLSELLQGLGYTGGIQDVARWLGMPYEDRYELNQVKFLEIEQLVMAELSVVNRARKGNAIIDTTGSVVHISDETCTALLDNSFVIYLEAPKDHLASLRAVLS